MWAMSLAARWAQKRAQPLVILSMDIKKAFDRCTQAAIRQMLVDRLLCVGLAAATDRSLEGQHMIIKLGRDIETKTIVRRRS